MKHRRGDWGVGTEQLGEGMDRTAVDAEEMNHHPDMDIRWRSVHFLLTTHDAGGLTQLDIELAHRISTYVTEGKGSFATA